MYGSILELSLWMNNRREGFLRDEEGASTVEMVIMMAAGISLGLSATDMVSRGIENLANDISDSLSNFEISTSFDDDAPSGGYFYEQR